MFVFIIIIRGQRVKEDIDLSFVLFNLFITGPRGVIYADQGVVSSIPFRSHTFVENDHEIFPTVILLLPLIQEGLVSVKSDSMCTKYRLTA